MEQQTEERKTRYLVGEKLYVIHFNFEGKEDFGFRMPFLYDLIPVSKINIIELTVKEHHRVLNEWANKDEVPSCDGFILEDKDGNIWHNQYPRASYGQVSDEGDRRFTRHLDDGSKFDEWTKNGVIFEAHLLSDVFSKMNRGIKELKNPKNAPAVPTDDSDEKINKLLELLPQCMDSIRNQLRSEFNKELHEYVIWAKYPDITAFEIRDMSTSAVLSQKHLS